MQNPGKEAIRDEKKGERKKKKSFSSVAMSHKNELLGEIQESVTRHF